MNSKFGRAGASGRGRKETPGPPPSGGPRGRGAGPEKFQLQQLEMGAVRPFAMAIRLTPELLRDLKRAEGEGEACWMKFGGTATGHVLKIGDEEFQFNSAREDGGLCDILEEQRRGEDGNGLLKDAGSVWRKLSVLRTLNASEKDRVKKRSVEAQQQQKSRKAIILDPTHSQNLTQNSSIAGDAVGRRPPIKTKVQPPRKKCKPNSLVRSPVPALAPVPARKPVVSTASAIASAKSAKAASVASPELPPSGKVASLPPPFPNGKPVAEEAATPSMSSVQMDSTSSPTTATPDVVGPAKLGVLVGPTELRNCLITLLTENPKGMTLKAVEKCLGDSMLHVKPEKKTIEKAIRAIASYHAPGKYILKEGVALAKPSPNSGSSPENADVDSPPLVDSPALPDMTVESIIRDEVSGGARLNESGSLGDKLGTLNSSVIRKAPSIVQKSNETAISRAIRKASESYQKSQPHSQQDHVRPTPDSDSQKVEGKLKKVDVVVETEQISDGGDESGGIEIIEGGGRPDMNGDTEFENSNGRAGTVPTSSKEKANSGGSESSSSSGSSDSDSESSDSGDSRSGTSGNGSDSDSGNGSDSDSDGSSSDSDDENMDEDVEIVSDDEGGDPPHQKHRANDKRKASHQSKEAKRAKLKPPEERLTRESEEIDVGGDNAAVHPVVKNLDIDDLEVDVVSVGGGDSPQNTGSVSPVVPEQQMEERRREVVNAPAVEDNRELLQKSDARGNNSVLSIEELTETGESGAQKDTVVRNRKELGKPKASTLKGCINSVANNRIIAKKNSVKVRSRIRAKGSPCSETNIKPLSRDSLAQSSSPSRVETGTQSLSGSPALKKGEADIIPRLATEYTARRRVNPEVRKSPTVEVKTESEELVEMLVEGPRPAKLAEVNRITKHVDASQSLCVDATPTSGARGSRDGEGSGFPGRETEAEVLPSASRPLVDGPRRQNSDGPGLLGKPGNFGRPQGRETEASVPTSKQLKHIRRAKNELDAARRNESMNDPDSWGKPTRDLDGTKLGNDSDVIFNRFRKESTGSEGLKVSLPVRLSRENEKRIGQGQDRESGEWRESTSGVEQLDIKGKVRSVDAAAVCRLALNKSQNRELRNPSPGKGAGDFSKRISPIRPVADFRKPSPGVAAGDLRKPSPVNAVGDLRNRSPVKAAGDTRKPSPVTSNAPKLVQVAQKEPPRFDQAVSRDSNRAVSGLAKLLPSSQAEERPEGGSSRNGRASNDTFERPMESRGVKRQLDDSCSERPRVYKKSTIVSVAASSSFIRGVADLGAAKSTERKQVSPNVVHKPQNSEADRAGSIEGSTNFGGPSARGPGGVNDPKQRLLGKTMKSSAKQAMEPPRGRDWKAKISAGLLGPGGEKKNDNLQSDPRLSNGKPLKPSSSPEEVSGKAYFAKYERDAPDLRGPIRSPEEAEAYKKEYQIKYHVYTRLYTDLDKNGGNFHSLKREMLLATSHPDKLQQISTRVRREFHAIRKEFKRMQKTFNILHDELQTIKQRLRNFAGKAGQG